MSKHVIPLSPTLRRASGFHVDVLHLHTYAWRGIAFALVLRERGAGVVFSTVYSVSSSVGWYLTPFQPRIL